MTFRFDYDYRTNDYKLVRLVHNSTSKCSDVDVYALGLNLWKSTQSIPYYLYQGSCCGAFFKGGLHWLAATLEQGSIKLICFNVANEIFQEVALPEEPMPYLEEPLEENMFGILVREFGGCLCLFFHVFNVRVDIWMMQEYGVKESWAKSFSIAQESILTSSTYSCLIWNFKNNESLWEVDEDLILHDPNNKIYRKLVLDSDFAECVTVTENSMASLSLN
ncbi:F-box/kelch-repeat protein At3g06240-like [Papaver somniferum]|uniref:F-box/kelch-repeat protein At3g06240-like n=1 Tax=Papaver somniferum TaxID=3469 RepID=UPI000E705316|nr:F-box/kelch-repeat protein At3g06240-like [Papaver somniferum]